MAYTIKDLKSKPELFYFKGLPEYCELMVKCDYNLVTVYEGVIADIPSKYDDVEIKLLGGSGKISRKNRIMTFLLKESE